MKAFPSSESFFGLPERGEFATEPVVVNMHFRFFIVKRKGKNIWRPEIDTWRPNILVKLPHGDPVKKLISDPELINYFHHSITGQSHSCI